MVCERKRGIEELRMIVEFYLSDWKNRVVIYGYGDDDGGIGLGIGRSYIISVGYSRFERFGRYLRR